MWHEMIFQFEFLPDLFFGIKFVPLHFQKKKILFGIVQKSHL